MSKERLGRNPFDRRTYSAKPGSKASAKAKAKPAAKARSASRPKAATRAKLKSGTASRKHQIVWKLVLEELLKLAPARVQELGICMKLRQTLGAWRDLRSSVST
jgi:hypothetical protein